MCPYIKNSYIRVALIHYDQDGNEDGSVVSESFMNPQCQREKCGAWYNGRCNYQMEEKK